MRFITIVAAVAAFCFSASAQVGTISATCNFTLPASTLSASDISAMQNAGKKYLQARELRQTVKPNCSLKSLRTIVYDEKSVQEIAYGAVAVNQLIKQMTAAEVAYCEKVAASAQKSATTVADPY
ncbi:MAG: hypothetical protein PHO56_03495 [Patescibacteria group bacterium]|nr:hypothetical protein [Patescibacteria group bacterium]